MRFIQLPVAIAAVALLAMPALASAACCTNGGNGVQMANAGLGESRPVAVNLSVDPTWSVYAFQRDGVSYYQVNDVAGQVVLIVANIEATFWSLPAGKAPVRVSLPSQRLTIPESARRRVVFQASDFSLALYGEGAAATWSVEPAVSGK